MVCFNKSEHKVTIMKNKKIKLNNTNTFVDNDLTALKQQEAYEIRKRLKEGRDKGTNPTLRAKRILLYGKSLIRDKSTKS